MSEETRPRPKSPWVGHLKSIGAFVGRYWVVGGWLAVIVGTIWAGFQFSLGMPGRFWVAWEVASLAATVAFCGVMFLDWFITGSQLDDVLKAWANGVAFLLSLVGIGMFVTAAGLAWFEPESALQFVSERLAATNSRSEEMPGWAVWFFRHWLVVHSSAITLGILCFLGINLLIRYCPRADVPAERRKEYEQRKQEADIAIAYSDLPIFVGFVVLTFLIECLTESDGANSGHLKAFLGGCVALELLVSNFVFGLGQLQTARRPQTETGS